LILLGKVMDFIANGDEGGRVQLLGNILMDVI
jgi:hypothetical protein